MYECAHCKQEFDRKTYGKNVPKFCSSKCTGLSRNLKIQISCSNCNTMFYKQPKEYRKTVNHFCSRSCAATYNNRHKKHGTRVSNLEKWVSEQLTMLYPDLEIHYNRKDAINSELDIYIPSLRMAFEINGIYHYKPIYGQDKLDKIISNDQQKKMLCEESNIKLYTIDTSDMNYFTVKKADYFLDEIKSKLPYIKHGINKRKKLRVS